MKHLRNQAVSETPHGSSLMAPLLPPCYGTTFQGAHDQTFSLNVIDPQKAALCASEAVAVNMGPAFRFCATLIVEGSASVSTLLTLDCPTTSNSAGWIHVEKACEGERAPRNDSE